MHSEGVDQVHNFITAHKKAAGLHGMYTVQKINT